MYLCVTVCVCLSVSTHYERCQILSSASLPFPSIPFPFPPLPIFAAVRYGEGSSNESGVVENGDFRLFRSLYLSNLHIQGHNYYIILY